MNKLITCSFSMDRDLYNAYKSIVVRNGENVKSNIIKYMQTVIYQDKPNPNNETLKAFEEVEQLKKDPNKRSYNSFTELIKDLDNE